MSYNTRGRRPVYNRGGRGAQPSRRLKKENIHVSKFIKAAQPLREAVPFSPENMFADFALNEAIHFNLTLRGLTAPSPIQDKAIPAGLAGKDVLGIANTGTGKTLAFAIPVLNKLISDSNAKALIMAPTRELARQIEDECISIGRGSRALYGALLIGGSPMYPQLRDLNSGPNIVIGTPGRIKDHLRQGSLDLSTFNIVVLDEVDMMLDMGFVNDVRTILSHLAAERQSFFFSATLDQRVNDLIKTFSHEPVTISVKTGETTDTVEQDVVRYNSKEQKFERLHNLLTSDPSIKALVFDDTQRSVERLGRELETRGLVIDSVHGGRSQSQRQRALDRFKKDKVSVLVVTDVAARGIDAPGVTHVINYSTPKTYTDYVHRIGRAGRAGKTGKAFTFIEA